MQLSAYVHVRREYDANQAEIWLGFSYIEVYDFIQKNYAKGERIVNSNYKNKMLKS